jgi:hypothetical protein
MLNQDAIREATRLTRAGQLVEATALLQRMLRGEREPGSFGSTARVTPARLEPPILDVKANVVEERESQWFKTYEVPVATDGVSSVLGH